MNQFFSLYPLQEFKPVLTALVLPPVPFLLLIIVAARILPTRRNTGWLLLLLSIAGLWLSTTSGGAFALARSTGLQPPALSLQRIQTIAAEMAKSPDKPRWAILVLGGGRQAMAPEYAAASLSDESLQRLRYGLWLARRTQAPVAFSGGQGWAQAGGDAEAHIAGIIAAEEFFLPLSWTESNSRDTRQNAKLAMAMLHGAGIERVLLVTNGWHMRRAMRAFAIGSNLGISVEAAPMDLSEDDDAGILSWLPSGQGATRFRQVLREALGFHLGA